MEMIKIEKDVHVRDKYGVRRKAFSAGQEVSQATYKLVLANDTLIEEVKPEMVNKMLPEVEVKVVEKEEATKPVEKVEVKPKVETKVEPKKAEVKKTKK